MTSTKSEMTRIGYWRPRNLDEHYAGIIADSTEADAERAERGEYVSMYVSASDLDSYGVSTKAEYLRVRAGRLRAEADRIWSLPVPQADTLPEDQRDVLAGWLDAGEDVGGYRGSSRCRVCLTINGSRELARDGFIYPSGLSHYVREHGCRVPGLPDEAWQPAS